MEKLVLKPGREKSLKRRHPWIFSGAIAHLEGEPGVGGTVTVHAHDGGFLAVAAWSPESQIRARVWDWRERVIDADFFRERIARAVARRGALAPDGAARLVHGESDGLPGVIADRYAETVVLQLTSAGAERWREAIADALLAVTGAARIFERSETEVRQLEGLPALTGMLRGTESPEVLQIDEGGLRFHLDPAHGHKTGFYLDQRDNRLRLRRMAAGCDVLDGCCYTGGFALNALRGGARSVVGIDSSGPALELARDNARINELPHAEWIEGDLFATLRRFRDQRRQFDLVVLDPPKFAPTAAHAERAARAYKDINLLGLKLLRPGGTLMTFSCSGGVSADLFQKIVAGAALDAGVEARLEARLQAPADHATLLSFPEGDYLKGLICRV